MEIWKSITEVDGYEVSNLGRVRNKYNNKVRKPHFVNGYNRLKLIRESKDIAVHRLVAQAFIPNPDNKPFVNHKNGYKNDNRANNLEWVTTSENSKHAYDTGIRKPANEKTILCIELNKKFTNSTEAAKFLNIETAHINSVRANIRRCCKGGRPTAYKYHWKFI